MKWLLRIVVALAVLLVICVGTLLALGMRADSDRLQTSAVIRRPPQAVWPWLVEGDKLKGWISWLKEVRRADGPLTTGTRGAWVMEDANNNGYLMTIDNEVTAVEANRKLAMKIGTPGMFTGTTQYTLTDLGNGSTRLDIDSHYRYDMWVVKLMSPLVMPQARAKMVSDLDHLRAQVEK